MLENCKRKENWTGQIALDLVLDEANLGLWGSRRQVENMPDCTLTRN